MLTSERMRVRGGQGGNPHVGDRNVLGSREAARVVADRDWRFSRAKAGVGRQACEGAVSIGETHIVWVFEHLIRDRRSRHASSGFTLGLVRSILHPMNRPAEQGARANDHVCHGSCCARSAPAMIVAHL